MPAHAFEADEAIAEGVKIKWLASIKEIAGPTLTVERMTLDATGRPRPTGEIETLEADVSISTGRPRVSVHRRSNSSPIPLASFTTGIGLRVIAGPLSMRWRNRYPAQGGWRCRLSWNRRDCRHGGYGRGTPLLRRRISSRRGVTPGAPESSGDRNAGTAMSRTPIRRQRWRGSEQM